MIVTTINKTQLSYWLAIVAAEYLLNLVPKGTHDWEKFVQPRTLRQIFQKCKYLLAKRLIQNGFYKMAGTRWLVQDGRYKMAGTRWLVQDGRYKMAGTRSNYINSIHFDVALPNSSRLVILLGSNKRNQYFA